LLWVWIPICMVGMVAVPWLAVILANDSAPKKRERRPAARQAPAAEALPEPLAIEPVRIIDAEQ
jgi:hypothetical protein